MVSSRKKTVKRSPKKTVKRSPKKSVKRSPKKTVKRSPKKSVEKESKNLIVFYKSHPDNTVNWNYPKITGCKWVGAGYDFETNERDVQFSCNPKQHTKGKEQIRSFMNKIKGKKYVKSFRIANKY